MEPFIVVLPRHLQKLRMNSSSRAVGRQCDDSLRQALRQATHALHVCLNKHPLLAGLAHPGYSLATYGVVMAAYFHFYRAIEACIERGLRHCGSPFNYASRRKLHWLQADLAVLAVDAEHPALCPPHAIALEEPLSLGGLVGLLYPIEGATLGGQVIARHLDANLGLTGTSGARFFHAYGAETERYWSEFQLFAEWAGADPAEQRRAVTTATHTFKVLENLLDGYHERHHGSVFP
jgi:heme oxygenase